MTMTNTTKTATPISLSSPKNNSLRTKEDFEKYLILRDIWQRYQGENVGFFPIFALGICDWVSMAFDMNREFIEAVVETLRLYKGDEYFMKFATYAPPGWTNRDAELLFKTIDETMLKTKDPAELVLRLFILCGHTVGFVNYNTYESDFSLSFFVKFVRAFCNDTLRTLEYPDAITLSKLDTTDWRE